MFYLARWIKSKEEQGWVVRPDVEVGAAFAALDLRGSVDAEQGIIDGPTPWCLLWTPDHLSPKRGHLIRLGDSPTDKSSTALTQLRNRLGWNPMGRGGPMSALTLGQLAFDFYHETADDVDKNRPNRLRPSDGEFVVRMGPHVMDSMPMYRAVGAAITDDFNRANEVPLNTAQWLQSTTNKIDLNANIARYGNSISSYEYAFHTTNCDSDDQYAQAEIAGLTWTTHQWGTCVRGLNTNADSSCYMVKPTEAGNREINSTNTTVGNPGRSVLSSNTGHSNGLGTVMRIEVSGSNLKAFFNTVENTGLAVTNTTYPGAATRRKVGIALYTGSGNLSGLDNFAGGDLAVASPQSISLETITGGSAFEPSLSRSITVIGSATTNGTTTPIMLSLPAGYAANDLLIAQMITREDDPTPAHAVTTNGVGWAQIGSTQFLDLGTDGISQSLWYKWAQSGSETLPEASCVSPLQMSVTITAFRYVDMTTPLDGVTVQQGVEPVSTTLQGQNSVISPVTGGAMALSFAASASGSNITLNQSNGFTLAYAEEV